MNNQNDLHGLNALVTGSSRGIGKNTAFALARAGANVVINSNITVDEAEMVVSELTRLNVKSFNISADVSDPNAVKSMFERINNEWGSIDILVNNAGIADSAPAEDLDYEKWLRMINVNLSAVFLCSQAAGKMMIAQKKGGVIINVSSICGHIVVHPQKQCHYNAAKGGVAMLTKSLAAEWAEHGIRVNAISPGYIGTDLVEGMKSLHPTWQSKTPLGRLGIPSEIADVIAFLASPKAAFVTGSDWIVDGGYVCW
jgi:NAD(P)-dependent dehydrogenase (short-subunit alcohol dehydrogenase family)